PHLILLDHELPGMLGIDFAKEIKADERTREIPLILITASVMKQEREAARAAGVDKFIEKPFDIVMLRNLVDSITTSA
ncbi:MAG: response regulator, partial [Nannocystaceae bacterium]